MSTAALDAAATRLLVAGMSYELARDLIADEIADVGAGCIARVARTAESPRTWRMVSADLERWQHPSCPAGYAQQLAVAARLMRCADREMGAALAVATLDASAGEGTEVFTVPVRSDAHALTLTVDSGPEVVPCGAGLDAHVEAVPGCTEGRFVATLRERATGRMAHRLAFAEGATRDEAVQAAVEAFRAAFQTADTNPPPGAST